MSFFSALKVPYVTIPNNIFSIFEFSLPRRQPGNPALQAPEEDKEDSGGAVVFDFSGKQRPISSSSIAAP